MSLVASASASASAYASNLAVLDMKIAEVQSFLDEDPECAPRQRKLEQLIQQRRHRDESLQKVSLQVGAYFGCLLNV